MNSKWSPNLFILGAQKCGTTTLHSYLSDMPDVCMSEPKEPLYFEAEFERGLEFYRERYFSHWRGESIVGEARPRNLYLAYVPARIHDVNPNAKLIVVVRNPIDRAYSQWYHEYFRGRENLSFREALRANIARIESGVTLNTPAANAQHDQSGGAEFFRRYLDTGYYYEQVQRYLRLFPRVNLKVILFEDLTEQPELVLNDLAEFLGLGPSPSRLAAPKRENRSLPCDGAVPSALGPGSIRYGVWRMAQWVSGLKIGRVVPAPVRAAVRNALGADARVLKDRKTRLWLREHYRSHNEMLAQFLDRDLSAWM